MDQKAIIRAVCISERKGEQCAAVCSTGTGLAAVCKTSHRSQISFQRAENVHYFDLPSRMTEPVSVALILCQIDKNTQGITAAS